MLFFGTSLEQYTPNEYLSGYDIKQIYSKMLLKIVYLFTLSHVSIHSGGILRGPEIDLKTDSEFDKIDLESDNVKYVATTLYGYIICSESVDLCNYKYNIELCAYCIYM